MIHRLTRGAQGPRFLLVALLLLLVVVPLLAQVRRPVLMTMLVTSVLVAGVVAVGARAVQVRVAFSLAALHILLAAASFVIQQDTSIFKRIVWMGLAALAVLFLYSTYLVLRFVLDAHQISSDQVYAGICVYLMIGYSFGSLYHLLHIVVPSAFVVNAAMGSSSPDLMYFSFITLATVGYGDITPASALARSLAQLEGLAGTLYMATFMARLVSLQTTAGEKSDTGR